MADNKCEGTFTQFCSEIKSDRNEILLCPDLRCTKNCMRPTTIYSRNVNVPWLLDCECHECGKTWSVCRVCPKTKLQLVNKQQILHHKYRYHQHGNESKDAPITMKKGSGKPSVKKKPRKIKFRQIVAIN